MKKVIELWERIILQYFNHIPATQGASQKISYVLQPIIYTLHFKLFHETTDILKNVSKIRSGSELM